MTFDTATQSDWWLDNVRLETTLVETGGGGARTDAVVGAVHIVGGRIAEVRHEALPAGTPLTIDAGGRLLMPTLRDAHVHLDKTFYGGPWRAPTSERPWPERKKEEVALLPEMSREIPTRSNAILDLLLTKGSTSVVAHCNVDHVVGTRNVAGLLDVLRGRDDIDWELTAFPQHGMQGGRIKPLLAEALQLGATMVGGLDPGSVEGDVEGVLDDIFELAVNHDVAADFHLHDGGSLGRYELDRIITRTLDTGWQGRVSLSVADCLTSADETTVRDYAERLAEAGIGLTMTARVAGTVLPLTILTEAGVSVSLGSDSITDIITPFGQGDILEQLWILDQAVGWFDELSLARSLRYGAGSRGLWTSDGERTWPRAGEPADFMLVPATCSAEAIARRVGRDAVYRQGRLVAGSLPQT